MFWDPLHWEAPLGQFARASGFTLTAFDPSLQRRFGPMMHQPLAKLLSDAGAWDEGGPAAAFELELARQCAQQQAPVQQKFGEALVVGALPGISNGHLEAVLVFGWVMDHFADPVRCEHLARSFALSGHQLWLTARQQPPVSAERFEVMTQLLRTLSTAIINELALTASLRETGRMKDEFLAIVSHELKTPLTSMQLRAEMLQRMGLFTDERSRGVMQGLTRSIEAQVRLVEDLLDGSRLVTGKLRLEPSRVDLVQVCAHAVDTIAPTASAKRISLRFQPPREAIPFHGDPARLQQALLNLLGNAVKFTPPEGTVGLRIERKGSEVRIAVTDTGRGIERAFLPFVFDRFSQARLTLGVSNKGLGLGLAIARQIVELHGGTLSATSEGPDRGTTFELRLPLESAA